MKRPVCLAVLLTLAALALFPAAAEAAAQGKPEVPPSLREALATLTELERRFEGGSWDEAQASLRELRKLFPAILQSSGKVTSSDVFYNFGYAIGKLQVSLMNRNRSETSTHFLELQDIFLALADQFAFEIPPALESIDRFVAEAKEDLEKSDYGEVVWEMREVSKCFRHLYGHLESKGVSFTDIWGYHRQINAIMAAAEAGSRPATRQALDKLEGQTAAFLALFTDESPVQRTESGP